jgi:hypothetical protein
MSAGQLEPLNFVSGKELDAILRWRPAPLGKLCGRSSDVFICILFRRTGKLNESIH